MQISLRVTIQAGARTKTAVDVYALSSKTKVVTLKNGVRLTNDEIAEWLEKSLLEAIHKLEEKEVGA